MANFDEKLSDYIKKELLKTNPNLDIKQISYETDLSNIGVESIVVISLLSQIEKEFKINISLESMEKNGYIISIKSITESINYD